MVPSILDDICFGKSLAIIYKVVFHCFTFIWHLIEFMYWIVYWVSLKIKQRIGLCWGQCWSPPWPWRIYLRKTRRKKLLNPLANHNQCLTTEKKLTNWCFTLVILAKYLFVFGLCHVLKCKWELLGKHVIRFVHFSESGAGAWSGVARVHSAQSAEEAPPNLDTIRSTGGNKLNINFLLCYRLHKYLLSRYGQSIKCILYYSLSFQKNQHTCRYAY